MPPHSPAERPNTVLLGPTSYLVTGEFSDRSVITVAFTGLATVLYCFNERIWKWIDLANNCIHE